MSRHSDIHNHRYAIASALVCALCGANCGARSSIDGASDAGNGLDADASLPRSCDPESTFIKLSALSINSGFDDFDIRFTPDERTAYFISNRARQPGSGVDVFTTRREDLTSSLSSPEIVTGLANPNAAAPNPTPDSLNMVFENGCVPALANKAALCGATRPTQASAFEAPFTINVKPDNGSFADFGGSAYTIHGATIVYFQANHIGANAIGLARAARIDATSFGPIVAVAIQDAPSGVLSAPVVSEDETILYFVQAQGVTVTIWVATRTTPAMPFANAHVVAELPTSAYPNWLSPDGCRLYFTGTVDSDSGSHAHLFVATR